MDAGFEIKSAVNLRPPTAKSAVNLLSTAELVGIVIEIEGDTLHLSGPEGAEDIAREILSQKAEVIAQLRAGGKPTTPALTPTPTETMVSSSSPTTEDQSIASLYDAAGVVLQAYRNGFEFDLRDKRIVTHPSQAVPPAVSDAIIAHYPKLVAFLMRGCLVVLKCTDPTVVGGFWEGHQWFPPRDPKEGS